jgi:hypothetical protein
MRQWLMRRVTFLPQVSRETAVEQMRHRGFTADEIEQLADLTGLTEDERQ